MHCVCVEHRLSFSTRVPMQSLITANQRWTLTVTRILSPSSIWWNSAHLPWMNSNHQPLDRKSVSYHWLHRSLQIWMLLISGNGVSLNFQTLCRSFPVINLSKLHMSIQYSLLATLKVSNCCAERARGNHEIMFSVNSEWWSPWQLDDHCTT